MVESQEDVGTFDANISPSCSSVMKQVDARRLELTNASHAAILEDEINQVLLYLHTYTHIHIHTHTHTCTIIIIYIHIIIYAHSSICIPCVVLYCWYTLCCVSQIRMGVPILLSALKTLVNLKQSKSEGVLDAQENR